MFNGTGFIDPRPYHLYQFHVGVVNNAGGVESEFSVAIETPSDGKVLRQLCLDVHAHM